MEIEHNEEGLPFSKKRVADNLSDALAGAAEHIDGGPMAQYAKTVFSGKSYGPEPVLTFTLIIRRDAATPDRFFYQGRTEVSHGLGRNVNLRGLEL